MTRIFGSIALTALLAALAASPAASAKPARTTNVAQVSMSSFKDMETLAFNAARDAEEWQTLTQNPYIDADAHRASLLQIRQKVNRLGAELAALEARHDSLDPAQQHAIDAVLPLLKDTAANLEAATLHFNQDRGALWTPAYRHQATTAAADCAKIASTLRNCLKYEKTRRTEQHLESVIGIGGN